MVEPSELEGAIAVQVNAIVREAMSEAFKWLCHREYGIDYVPPLFVRAFAYEPPKLLSVEKYSRLRGRRGDAADWCA
jgi:hypothetical protein